MTKTQKEKLLEIADQLYQINNRNIGIRWIGFQEIPTPAKIIELNEMLAFIIKEMKTLADTGKLDVDKLHKEYFEKLKGVD